MFLKNPYIPDKNVSIVLIDGRVDENIESGFEKIGVKLLRTLRHPDLYNAVSYHPDMFIHHMGEKIFVYAPNTPIKFLEQLQILGAVLIRGETVLKSKYPQNIAYNIARVGNYAIHNLKYTDNIIKDELQKRGVKFLHVNQGYTKCSIMIVNENSIITSDKMIAKVAEDNKINVLLTEVQKDIFLHDLGYGFIGGSSGLIAKDKIIVTGNKFNLNRITEMDDFTKRQKKEILSVSNDKIVDVGSVIPLKY